MAKVVFRYNMLLEWFYALILSVWQYNFCRFGSFSYVLAGKGKMKA